MEDVYEQASDIHINPEQICLISEQYDHPNRTFKYYMVHMNNGFIAKITDKKIVEGLLGSNLAIPKQGKKK